jgi:hypothetical protein
MSLAPGARRGSCAAVTGRELSEWASAADGASRASPGSSDCDGSSGSGQALGEVRRVIRVGAEPGEVGRASGAARCLSGELGLAVASAALPAGFAVGIGR